MEPMALGKHRGFSRRIRSIIKPSRNARVVDHWPPDSHISAFMLKTLEEKERKDVLRQALERRKRHSQHLSAYTENTEKRTA